MVGVVFVGGEVDDVELCGGIVECWDGGVLLVWKFGV